MSRAQGVGARPYNRACCGMSEPINSAARSPARYALQAALQVCDIISNAQQAHCTACSWRLKRAPCLCTGQTFCMLTRGCAMHILVALACDAERLATTAVQRAQPASTGVESMPGAGGMACIFKVGS